MSEITAFDKRDSTRIKGFAILLLLMHHLFCSADRFAGYEISFWPFTQDFVVSVSLMMKICVSIFAFISGFGLCVSISRVEFTKSSVTSWTLVRMLKTMSGFYFIYIVCFLATLLINRLPIEIYFSGSRAAGIIYVLVDFLGLSHLFETPTLIATWWYMTAALFFIVMVPVVYFLARKIGYIPTVFMVIALPRFMNVGYPGGGVNPYTFLLPVFFGMICAEYDVFGKIRSWICRFTNQVDYRRLLAVNVSLMAMIVVSWFIFQNISFTKAWELEYGAIPVVVVAFARFGIVGIPLVGRALEFIGRHSMTIFLTHNFLRVVYLKDFFYSSGNFLIIFLLLLIASIALACVLDMFKKLIGYDRLVSKTVHCVEVWGR